METLKFAARKKVKLLKEKTLAISKEANDLLKNISDDDTDYLYSNINRA